MWESTLASIENSPWIGHGLGSSYSLYFRFVTPFTRLTSEVRSYKHAHSEVLEVMQEGGVLGLVLYLAMWSLVFYGLSGIIRDKELQGGRRLLALATFVGLVGYNAHSLASVAPRMMVAKLPVYSLLGIAFVLYFDRHKSWRVPNWLKRASRPGVITGGSLALYLVCWIVLTPWLSSTREHREFTGTRFELGALKALESRVGEQNNIYTLFQPEHMAHELTDLLLKYCQQSEIQHLDFEKKLKKG